MLVVVEGKKFSGFGMNFYNPHHTIITLVVYEDGAIFNHTSLNDQNHKFVQYTINLNAG